MASIVTGLPSVGRESHALSSWSMATAWRFQLAPNRIGHPQPRPASARATALRPTGMCRYEETTMYANPRQIPDRCPSVCPPRPDEEAGAQARRRRQVSLRRRSRRCRDDQGSSGGALLVAGHGRHGGSAAGEPASPAGRMTPSWLGGFSTSPSPVRMRVRFARPHPSVAAASAVQRRDCAAGRSNEAARGANSRSWRPVPTG